MGSTSKSNKRSISKRIHFWLLSCVLIAFTIATILSYAMNTKISRENTQNILQTNLEDVCNAVQEADSLTIVTTAKRWAEYFDRYPSFAPTEAFLTAVNDIAASNDIDELCFIDKDGIIVSSNNKAFLGYDMASADQSREFMVLLTDSNVETYSQGVRERGYDKVRFLYAGARFKRHKGFLEIGISETHYRRMITGTLKNCAKYRRIGDQGAIYILDKDGNVISAPKSHNQSLADNTAIDSKAIGIDKARLLAQAPSTIFECTINGTACYCMYSIVGKSLQPGKNGKDDNPVAIVLATQPVSEATLTRNTAVSFSTINVFVIFLILFVAIWLSIRKLVVKNINKVNNSLDQITNGNLQEVVNVRDSAEFDALSTDINKTVDRLKGYIHEAETRMDEDLAMAKAIQHSALPSIFPAFPERKDFDIYAGMLTAKEVGGDFYDFYFSGENSFTITIADVSGKGIPAAMFMMRSKAALKNVLMTGEKLGNACADVNRSLCENNDTNTFFTGWIGTIDLTTGVLTYVNAGHNLPAIRHAGEQYAFLPSQPGMPMAVIDDYRYTTGTIQLHPGDEIFLYTDGVTEAENKNKELYGDDRLLSCLNNCSAPASSETLVKTVVDDVSKHADGAEQSDDITVLSFRYTPKKDNHQ